jgi:hypothetical protein
MCTPEAQVVEFEDELEAAEGRWVKEVNLLPSMGMAREGWVRERVERRRERVSADLMVGEKRKRVYKG